jgi:hypothetical protein
MADHRVEEVEEVEKWKSGKVEELEKSVCQRRASLSPASSDG